MCMSKHCRGSEGSSRRGAESSSRTEDRRHEHSVQLGAADAHLRPQLARLRLPVRQLRVKGRSATAHRVKSHLELGATFIAPRPCMLLDLGVRVAQRSEFCHRLFECEQQSRRMRCEHPHTSLETQLSRRQRSPTFEGFGSSHLVSAAISLDLPRSSHLVSAALGGLPLHLPTRTRVSGRRCAQPKPLKPVLQGRHGAVDDASHATHHPLHPFKPLALGTS